MATLIELSTKFDNLNEENFGESIKTLEIIMNFNDTTDEGIKLWEKAIYRLASLYSKKNLAAELIELTKNVLPILKDIPHKSKTAKIIRTLFDFTIGFTGCEL